MTLNEASNRFVIVSDEGDWSWTGHNHFYSVSVAEAAVAAGRETVILAPRSAKQEDAALFKIIPYIAPQQQLVGQRQAIRRFALRVLPKNISSTGLAKLRSLLEQTIRLRIAMRKVGLLGRAKSADNDSFGVQMAYAIKSGAVLPSDLVFVHTILTHSLESLFLSLVDFDSEALPQFRLTLRTDPGEVATRYGRQFELREILRCFWDNRILRDRIVFLTDTEELKGEYDKLSPFRFSVIPIPIAVPLGIVRDDPAVLTLTYVGAIRRERGFLLLPKLAQHLATRNYPRPVKLVVQAGGLSGSDDPQVREALEDLGRFSGLVDLVTESLPPDRYAELLHNSDVVLLPYDAHRYRARSSGVLAEALKLGRPTVIPDKTWMARVAAASGKVFSEEKHGPSFVEAVDEAIDQFSALRAEALRLSRSWQDEATPAAVYSAVWAS